MTEPILWDTVENIAKVHNKVVYSKWCFSLELVERNSGF